MEVRDVCATGNVIIAGAYRDYTSNAYFFRSTDNGVTWAMTDSFGVDNTSPGVNFVIYPSFTFLVDGADIFASVGGGVNRGDIYRSTDDGITWSDKGISWPESGTDQAENISAFCAAGQDIFAATFHGVFLSTDQGRYWNPANSGFPTTYTGFPPVAGHLLATGNRVFAGTADGIFESSDAGATWNSISQRLNGSLAAIGTDIFVGVFQFPADTNGGVFVSKDNGASWNPVNNGLTEHTINTLITDGTNLYAGTNSGAFFSTNQGAHWSFISTGSHTDSMVVLCLAVGNSRLVEGTLNGVSLYPLSQLSGTGRKATQVRRKQKGG